MQLNSKMIDKQIYFSYPIERYLSFNVQSLISKTSNENTQITSQNLTISIHTHEERHNILASKAFIHS